MDTTEAVRGQGRCQVQSIEILGAERTRWEHLGPDRGTTLETFVVG